ncbi:MAG: PstS family phosphate ABC transporter substrate-binding protein [Candidatus Omnitrophica bacterium]|nr:PstS family phosphate ABC transporter substrate-binding protein [Candidatus Omnitrophota bacterium]
MKKMIILLGVLLGFIVSNVCYAGDVLQIKGSDTLINLVQRLAEEYMIIHPDKMIAVTGGGSGTGVAALINKKCDIANASRLMKSKEIDLAVQSGSNPVRIVVALDSLSIIVNPKNPVKALTVDQVGKIYKGEIKNWKEVGGEDMPIALYGRQSNSGTYDFMIEDVMKGDYSPSMRQMNGNAQIVEGIKSDPSAVGYVGVGYAKSALGIKVLEIAAKVGATAYSPLDVANVKNGNYPITRPLNQYVEGSLVGDAKDFVAFELSAQGQKIVEDEGFFEISKEYQDFNKNAGI